MPQNTKQSRDQQPLDMPSDKQGERVKDPIAVELGRRGGLKGGKARAAKLTPERLSEIGKKGAAARAAKRATERRLQQGEVSNAVSQKPSSTQRGQKKKRRVVIEVPED